ncbi:MAG TPA: hypothetical protein VKT21_04600 [Thermoplasmata archaeon]|nr:hypothetical protein [Thermoplasmata archaeon]
MAAASPPLGRIDGDYELAPGGTLRPPPGSPGIELTGILTSRGSGTVEGSLSCREIRIEGGALTVRGGLRTIGAIRLRHGRLEVAGDLFAASLEGDKGLVVRGNLECPDVDIGGSVEVSGTTKGDQFEVGGAAELRGAVDLTSLEVGGRVTIGGGTVRRAIQVGGRFETTGALTFGALEIGGMARLRGPARGESVEVGGLIECDADLVATHGIEVGGRVRVAGKLQSARIEIGGLLSAAAVDGDEIEVGGVAEVEGAVAGRRLEVGGRLSAERVVVTDRVEVGDEIRTKSGVRTGSLRLGDRSTVRGPIVAREVTVGEHAEIEDVWAGSLRLRSRARARNVYGDDVEVASGVEIQGETQFVRSLRGEGARFAQPPRQVSQLPAAPL